MKNQRVALDLYVTHRAALTRYARSIVTDNARAENLVQDAWVKMDRAQDPELIRDPVSYFYRIVRNAALDARRVMARENSRVANAAEAQGLADESLSAERSARPISLILSHCRSR